MGGVWSSEVVEGEDVRGDTIPVECYRNTKAEIGIQGIFGERELVKNRH